MPETQGSHSDPASFPERAIDPTLARVVREDVPLNRNLKLEPVVAVPVRALPVEPPQPEPLVLAQVDEDGYRQRIVGRASDLPATLAWLEERGAGRQHWD